MNRLLRFGPALAYLAITCCLYTDAIVLGGTFFERDIQWVWYPQVEFAVRSVAAGRLPWWNPYVAFGLPALADPSYEFAYPPTWLNLIIQPWTYYKLFVVGHTVLAGFGARMLARRWGVGALGSFAAGAGYMCSGPFLSLPSMFHHFAGAAWMPWTLVAFEGLLTKPCRRSALVLGVTSALQIVAGSGDMCFMTALIGLVRAGVWFRGRPGPARNILATSRSLVVAGAVALGLSAVQWMPTASVISNSTRAALQDEIKMYWSVHPLTLVDHVVPTLVSGTPLTPEAIKKLFEGRDTFMRSLFLGIVVLVGAAAAVGARSHPLARPLGLLACFLVLCSLGQHTPFYRVISQWPPFSILRYPVKYTVPLGLLVSLLAGMGIDAWVTESRGRAQRIGLLTAAAACLVIGVPTLAIFRSPLLFTEWLGADPAAGAPIGKFFAALAVSVCLLLLMVFAFRARSSKVWAVPAVVALLVTELVVANRRLNKAWPIEATLYRPQWVKMLRTGPPPPRLFSEAPSMNEALELADYQKDMLPRAAWDLWLQDLVAPPRGSRWGIAGSFDEDLTGLLPRAHAVLRDVLRETSGHGAAVRLLRLGSVEYVVSRTEQPWLGPQVKRIQTVAREPLRLYTIEESLPRIRLVTGYRVEPVLEKAVLALFDPGFDIASDAVFEVGAPSARQEGFAGAARLVEWYPDEIVVETTASHAARLVVTDAFDKSWEATVDGQKTPVLKADLLFRGVDVAAGRHLVRMKYRPRAAILGFFSSLATLALIGGVTVLTPWRSGRLGAA